MPSHFPSDPPAAVDIWHFRQALSQFATGVTINCFNSVSLDPPPGLWNLARTAGSMAAFEGAGGDVINVPTDKQAELAQRFARCGDDRFDALDFTLSPQGMPLLAGTVAPFGCRARHRHAEGDHVIFVGAVERRQFHPHRSLGFHRGRFIAIS